MSTFKFTKQKIEGMNEGIRQMRQTLTTLQRHLKKSDYHGVAGNVELLRAQLFDLQIAFRVSEETLKREDRFGNARR